MIDLGFEVIGPGLGDQYRLGLALALAGNDRVDIGLVIDAPFDVTVAALKPHRFLRRGGDHVLDDVAGQSFGRAQCQQTDPVVLGTALAHNVERRRNIGHLAGADDMGEMLPEIDGMRVLARRTAAARGKNRDSCWPGPKARDGP